MKKRLSSKNLFSAMLEFLEIAQEGTLSASEFRSLRMTAFLFIQGVLIALILIPLEYLAGGLRLALYGIVLFTVSLICFFGIRWKWPVNPLRLIFCTTGNFLIIGMSTYLGQLAEIHFFYIPAMTIPFLIYSRENVKSLYFSVALPILFLLTEGVLSLVRLPTENQSQHDVLLIILGSSSALTAAGLTAFSFFYFYQQAHSHEAKLIAQNETLVTQEKLSTLGIVAAGVAHEINNPLTIILGSTVAAQRILERQDKSDPRVLKQLNTIRSTTNRIAKIVASLRVFSRDSRNDDTQVLFIEDIIDQAQSLTQQKLKTISVTTEIPKGVLIQANSTELLQIFINLINNAMDAQKNAVNPWLKITGIETSGFLKVTFQDSGSGIPYEVQRRLFTPFFTTKPVGHGTGLGLSISKRLIESRGGKLTYQLLDNHTAFILEIPTLQQKEKIDEPA